MTSSGKSKVTAAYEEAAAVSLIQSMAFEDTRSGNKSQDSAQEEDPAEHTILFSSDTKDGSANDKPNPPTHQERLLSVTTQHESEAETKLLQAIEQERTARTTKSFRRRKNKVSAPPKSFSSDMPHIPLPTSDPPLSRQQSSLSYTTQYVEMLQEGEPVPTFRDPLDAPTSSASSSSAAAAAASSLNHTNLAHASSIERFHYASPVLRKAAVAFKKNLKKDKPQQEAPLNDGSSTQEQPLPHHPTEPSSDALPGDESGAAALAVPGDDDDNNATSHPPDVEEGKKKGSGGNKYLRKFTAFPRKTRSALVEAFEASKQEWHMLSDFFQPKRESFFHQLWIMCLMTLVPAIIVAAILFYGMDNPPTGRCKDGDDCGVDASASWWVLFLGCRQVLILLLAKATDIFVIDFVVLQHPLIVRMLGAQLSLVVVQAKGWPSVLCWWALWDSIFLYGSGSFPKHWLFFQDVIGMFNKENPAGLVTSASWHQGMIVAAVVIGVATAFKRHFLGLHLGRRIYNRFNERVEETMKEILLVSELALWARRKRDQGATYSVWVARFAAEEDVSLEEEEGEGGEDAMREDSQMATTTRFESERGEELDYDHILEPWTEPSRESDEEVSGKHIIEFRQAYSVMTKAYFFSSSFGSVDTRGSCVQSADRLFRRLLKLFEEDDALELASLMRWLYKGCHRKEEKENAAYWALMLNPDVEGRVDVIDFVKAIDNVYKKLRLLENAINNASHIDKGYEQVINTVFFLLVGMFALAVIGVNVIDFILGISALLVAFSFMIGPGAAVYFEGVMMILARSPYDVGDKIAIGTVEEDPNDDGSAHWLVEHADLITTTARLMATNEVASFSNGALASMRIINMNRSPDPIVYVRVRFDTDVPYSKILIFKNAVEKFVEDRPQEWAAMLGFRSERVESQEQFVEYSIVLQHRGTWQDLIEIKESKAVVASFCVESQKQLSCRYESSRSLPANVNASDGGDDGDDDGDGTETASMRASMQKLLEIAKMFQTNAASSKDGEKEEK